MPNAADTIRLSFLQWLAAEDEAQQAQYRAFREYYDGEHATQLTRRMAAFLQVKYGEEFNANFCPIVVDALAERLSVTGFEAADEDLLWEWWGLNRMDGQQGIVHTSGIRDGDVYVLVEWDNEEGRPAWYVEPAYDGREGVKVHYSKEQRGQVAYATKRWKVEGEDPSNAGYKRRINAYFPDRIEKYVSNEQYFEGNWAPYKEDGEEWPLPWVDEAGEPLGVPIVHFKNKERGYDWGRSELADVVPLQNAQNKVLIDLLAASDVTGFQNYWMIGDDPSGLETTPGSWVFSTKPPSDVSVGVFPPADPKPLLDVLKELTLKVAQVTRTPISYFQASGQTVAEGTLKQQEAGLVARAENRQVYFGNAWEDVVKMSRRLNNAFGPGGLDPDAPVSAQWADPETRNEKELAETLAIKAEKLRVPIEQLWSEFGYSPEEIEAMQATEEYQARIEMQQAAMQGLGAAMRPGGDDEEGDDERENE
jgi:hypothetical protein